MNREEILAKVTRIIREVFNDDTIVVTDATVAGDVAGWDSLMHITLISTVEDEFDIQIPMKDIVTLKDVGHLVDLIAELVD